MGETGFAHDAFAHHAPGQAYLNRGCFKILVWCCAMLVMQGFGQMLAPEIIGESLTLTTQGFKFFAALGNQLVFIG
jgi:predicted phage tail protein